MTPFLAASVVALALSALLGTSPQAQERSTRTAKPTASRPSAGLTETDWAARSEVREFVRTMVERHDFDEAGLWTLLSRTRLSESVLKLIAPAPSGFKKSWATYRSRFIDPVRTREGVRFWRDNAEAVRRASNEYGVPEDIIVSIIGIETIYGRHLGDFRVMDALTTLAFAAPRRAEYFREELEHYLLLSRENRFDPLDWRGSYAGAVGLPQFMPGSIRRHAVDFDGDGRIDLRGSPTDAVGSVARFLANHGWKTGQPTHFGAVLGDEARAKPAVDIGIPPRLSPKELAGYGVASPQPLPEGEALALIDLPMGDAPTQYVLGAQNFYVITRYNRSYFYAMVVIDFAQELRTAAGLTTARVQ
jgi:membrane-bound lytic murein transglycosylase B